MNAASHFAVRSRQFPDRAGVQPNDPLPLGYRRLGGRGGVADSVVEVSSAAKPIRVKTSVACRAT